MSRDGSTWVPTSLWALGLGALAWRVRWWARGGREGRGGAGGMGNRDIWFTRSGLDNAIYVWID